MQSACLIEQSLEVAGSSGCRTGGRLTRIDRSGINRTRKKVPGDKEGKIGPSVEGVTAIYLIGLIRRGRMVITVRPQVWTFVRTSRLRLRRPICGKAPPSLFCKPNQIRQ